MKKKKILIIAFTIILFAIIVYGVYSLFYKPSFKVIRKSVVAIDPKYAEYISAVTSGIISSQSTIKIVLSNQPSLDSVLREKIIKNIFNFNPSINGKTRWINDYTIEFIPEKALISGQFYEGEFYLERVFRVTDEFKKFKFSFQVIKQDYLWQNYGLQCYNEDINNYYLTGLIKTADVISNENIEKILIVEYDNKIMSVKWEHADQGLVHKFIVDSIRRFEKENNIKLKFNGFAAGIDKRDEANIIVPAKGVFEVINVKLQNYPEQVIKINFSDPVDPNQNLEGLIYLSDNTNLKFSIEGNLVKVYPSRKLIDESITLKIEEGVKQIFGKSLKKSYEKEFTIKGIKPAVEMVGKGVIMPGENGMQVPFRAVNLKAVDVEVIKIYGNNILQFLQINNLQGNNQLKRVARPVLKQMIDLSSYEMVDFSEWHTYSLDLSQLIKFDPAAIYRVTLSFKREYSVYNCGDEIEIKENDNIPDEEIENWDEGDEYEYSNWDNTEDYYVDYSDYWANRDNPCHEAYYKYAKKATRNILYTNLGVIAKLNNKNDVTAIITNLNTSEPLNNVKVELYNYQQQIIASGETNSDGIINLHCENKPYFLIAKKDKERNYLILKDGESLSLSMFDVTGESIQKGLKGFIYGERGVWRPGDTIFITFILEDKDNFLPKDHPVIFELSNPMNQLVNRIIKTSNINNFYTVILTTNANDPTGNWNLRVKVGGVVFNKTLKIETIKPNRLDIKLDFESDIIKIGRPLNGKLRVKWLSGAKAPNLKALITATFSNTSVQFKRFNDYIFEDPTKIFFSDDKKIFEGRLDENGNANINYILGTFNSAPGFLKANMLTKVFEESGEFSVDYSQITIAPYNIFVGIKTPKGDAARGMLLTDIDHEVSVITVDADGNPVSRSGLKAYVYKINWRWWWDKSEEDLASYAGTNYHNPIIEKTISTTNGEGKFYFKIKYPDWGRYLIKVIDGSGHSSGKIVYVDWPGWAGKPQDKNPEGASMLTLITDKEKYNVGEKIKLTLPSAKNSRALISIESGSKIINMFWFNITGSKDKEVIEIPVSENMAPNAYINVTLIQAYKDLQNDLPLRMYGITPVFVENPATRLNPVLTVPDKVASEETFIIKVNEQSGKAMTYTIAIVDEGLLGLTRFKVPDPHKAFYAREALGIKTWDIYEYVFGGFAGKIDKLYSVGGDEDFLVDKNKTKSDRFKPVVKFLGPFELKKGAENLHSFKMPKYTGAVRTMLVAGQRGAYGCDEKITLVKNPLMILSTLPRVLSINESITLPVTVFSDESSIKEVSVEIKTNKLLKLLDNPVKKIEFKNPGNEIITFNIKTSEFTGIGSIKIIAKSGNIKTDYDIEVDVRNPNPKVSDFYPKFIQPEDEIYENIQLKGIQGTNSAFIEFSSFPSINLSGRINQLIQYPHGCIEQTTSTVFPQLYLGDVIELSKEEKENIENNIKAGIERIKTFQNYEGGFSYWPGNSTSDEWATSYVGNFLLEASKKGFFIPAGLKTAWIKYQQKKAQSWHYSDKIDNYSDEYIQAYRLFTLSLAGEAEIGSMNRLKENSEKLQLLTKYLLAASYAIAGQENIANEMINKLDFNIKTYNEQAFTYGSDLRDKAIILEILTLLKQYERAAKLVEELTKALSGNQWLSTQTTAFCLKSLSNFIYASGKFKDGLNFIYTVNGISKNIQLKQNLIKIDLNVQENRNLDIKIKNKNKTALFAQIVYEYIPFIGEETEVESNISLKVVYKDMKGNILNIENIKQGTDFKAEVTVSNPGILGEYKNLSITHIIPSGWEIINTRLSDFQSAAIIDQPDYQDIRDDRIYSYTDLLPGKSKTFVVLLNATYAGEYYLPAIVCETMYDKSIFARKKGMWIKVNK
jgi:uncharacterized protein YfaS (alpha-2-macroglobulin family)